MSNEPSSSPRRTRRVRRLVAAIVLAESIVVIGAGFVLGISTLVGDPTSVTGSLAEAVFALVLGVAVAAVGRGVWLGQRWSRAPGLVWQVLQVAVGAPALQNRPLVGYPLVVVAVLAAVGLLTPGVVEDPPDGRSPLSQD